jgi:hypothetical protein
MLPIQGFEISPFCAELCSKKAMLARRPPRTEAELLDGSRHCWCRSTMEAVGPDGALVDPEDCRVGRSCFRPWGGA